ncbi:MAG: EF-P lysine aminoacylase EpmA [Planctomycetota bacterium]|nr:EF-P lysine aminoacylase EpmA [Planctomycetota bacterium]
MGMRRKEWAYKTVEARSLLLKSVREFFYKEGFLEVETPIMVSYQCLDPNIKDLSVVVQDFSGRKQKFFLSASPENEMKKMLAAGFERIFQITRGFRDGEVTRTHNPEFTILEWYRKDADYNDMMEDTVALIQTVANALGKEEISYQGMKCALFEEWEKLSLSEAFRRYAGAELFSEREDWEDWFFKTLIEKVEPKLGMGRPTFLYDYPKRLGTMAKEKEGRADLLERVELYICGMELADGYSELTEAEEQERRFREASEREGKIMDVELLDALKKGLPRCAGIALGIDRLLMLFIDAPSIADVLSPNFSNPA